MATYSSIFPVDDYGAFGDGVRSDTSAIQDAINAAYAAGGGRVVFRSSGVYMVGEVFLRPGIEVDLNGSTVKRLANQGNFIRTFSVPETSGNPYRWGGTTDSRPVTVRNGIIDGNSPNQGAYQAGQLEQAHLLMFAANPATPGRLRVILEDLVLRDSVADGISIYTNVDVQISNCRTESCWRGGFVAGGGYSRIQIQNLELRSGIDSSHFDIEADGVGYGSTLAQELQVDGLVVEGDFDVAARGGSRMTFSNVLHRVPGFYLEAENSVVSLTNSEFRMGELSSDFNRVVTPHDVSFVGCRFIAEPQFPSPTIAATIAAPHIYWGSPLIASGMRLRFIDCVWAIGANIKSSDTVYGLFAEEDALSHGNELLLQGCDIPSTYQVGIRAQLGLRAQIRQCRIQAPKPISWNANEQDAGIDLTVDDLDVRGSTFYMECGSGYNAALKRIEHRNTQIDETDYAATTAGGFGQSNFVGGRSILVNSSPVGRLLSAMPGDKARLKTPVGGQVHRWICTGNDNTASAAVWKAEAALAP